MRTYMSFFNPQYLVKPGLLPSDELVLLDQVKDLTQEGINVGTVGGGRSHVIGTRSRDAVSHVKQ